MWTDETGLFWKRTPNRTYIAMDEKAAPDHKASKEREANFTSEGTMQLVTIS